MKNYELLGEESGVKVVQLDRLYSLVASREVR